jgi:ABC-type Fe3+-hydroxamate transport system substrate-binding protein
MGKWITTALLCAASMLGSALIASQGFGPDPIPEDTATAAECASITDERVRQDCIDRTIKRDSD